MNGFFLFEIEFSPRASWLLGSFPVIEGLILVPSGMVGVEVGSVRWDVELIVLDEARFLFRSGLSLGFGTLLGYEATSRCSNSLQGTVVVGSTTVVK